MKIGNIKFKAKRLDGKGWAIGDLLHSYENGVIIVPIEDNYAFMVASENEPLYWLPDVLEIGKIERIGNKFDKEEE